MDKKTRIAARIIDRLVFASNEDEKFDEDEGKPMPFKKWLDTFIDEKGIDLEQGFTVPGPSGHNHMTYQNVIDVMKQAPKHEQNGIKDMIVRIDFRNGDVTHYLRHLAQAIAI